MAKRARRGGGESDARGGGQLDNRSHSRATGKRREVVRGVRIRRYGGQRIAMRRPLGYGAGRMKHNYKHVDRSGRRHVAWETTGGILLSSAEAAKQQGLRPTHVALGGGNPPDRVEGGRSSDGRRQAGRKFAGGKYVGRHHLTDDQRKRLRCDAAALPDGRPDKEAWQWTRGEGGKRRKVHLGSAPPAEGQWCRWGQHGLWTEGKHYAGPLQPPSTPRVRSWNRFVAAAHTPESQRGAGRAARMSVDLGRRMWDLRRRVAQGAIERPTAIGAWEEQPEMLTYDTRSVVYVEVPLRRGQRSYVGETGESTWVRHEKRLHHVFAKTGGGGMEGRPGYARAEDELDEYERHLRQVGAEAARHERYVMVLERVSRRQGEGETELTARRKLVEKFWVATLHTAFNKKGWNVEHAPATLHRLPGGRPTRRAVKGQEEHARRRQRGRNGPCKRNGGRAQRRAAAARATHASGPDCQERVEGEMDRGREQGQRAGRRFHRGPRRGRAERQQRQRERQGEQQQQGGRRRQGGGAGGGGRGRRFEANDESVRVRRATEELRKGRASLRKYLKTVGLSMLQSMLAWMYRQQVPWAECASGSSATSATRQRRRCWSGRAVGGGRGSRVSL